MAVNSKKPIRAQVKLPLDAPSKTLRQEAQELSARLASVIGSMPVDERVEALNAARTVLHEVSPFASEPVDLVLWVKNDTVIANDYNPNAVAPPEMKLLQHSIDSDGYTQPIVAYKTEDGDEVVDGFHRHRVGKELASVRERVHGYLPVARINTERTARTDRIAATIRHNRARGEHGVDSMSDIVRQLYIAGWDDEQIQKELGMQLDEVVRLKQITGLAALFANREFSEAWKPSPSARKKKKAELMEPEEKRST